VDCARIRVRETKASLTRLGGCGSWSVGSFGQELFESLVSIVALTDFHQVEEIGDAKKSGLWADGNSYLIARFSQLLTSAVARQPEVFLDTADYLIDAVRQNTIPLWMMHAMIQFLLLATGLDWRDSLLDSPY